MQTPPPETGAASPKGGAALWVALALFAVIVLSNLLMLRPRLTDRVDAWSSRIMQADFAVRMLYGNLLPLGAVQPDEWNNVLKLLTTRNAPLGALARAIILVDDRSTTLGEQVARQRINDLLTRIPSAPTRFSAQQREAVIRWCRVVYGERRRISDAEAAEFRRTIDGANLGWMRLLALKHLEFRAGNADGARVWDARAHQEADRLQRVLLVVFGVVAFLILGGVAMWVAFFAWKTSVRGLAPVVSPLLPQHADTVLWGLAVYFGATYVGGWVGGVLARALPPSANLLVPLVLLVQVATGTVALWALHQKMRRDGVGWSEIGLDWNRLTAHFAWGTGAYVAMVPLLLVTVVLVQVLLPNLPSPAHPIAGVASTENPLWVTVLLFLVAGVFAPLFEEVFFRGVLLNAVWARTGSRWVGIVGSALVFSVLHPQLYLGWIAVFVIGVVLGLLFVERRSLVPCFWMHALNNSVALVAMQLLKMAG